MQLRSMNSRKRKRRSNREQVEVELSVASSGEDNRSENSDSSDDTLNSSTVSDNSNSMTPPPLPPVPNFTCSLPSTLKVNQCRVVLDALYDEVTTVFTLCPHDWNELRSERCWFCCKLFSEAPLLGDPVPCAIGMNWVGKDARFVVDGSFCSFSCSKAWCNDFFSNSRGMYGSGNQSNWGKVEGNANAFLFKAWTNQPLQVYFDMVESLPRRLLLDFGGPMTYTEYFNHNQPDPRIVLMHRKHLPHPMISCRHPLLEEVTVQQMSQNLSSEENMKHSRVVMSPADLLLKKRIRHLQSRGGHLNTNVGF